MGKEGMEASIYTIMAYRKDEGQFPQLKIK